MTAMSALPIKGRDIGPVLDAETDGQWQVGRLAAAGQIGS